MGPTGVSAPNLPVAPQEYSAGHQNGLLGVLRLFFTSITNSINSPIPYACYSSAVSQTNPVGGAVNLIKFEATDAENRIRKGVPPSKIYVAERGLYRVDFRAHLEKSGGPSGAVFVWMRLNGLNVAGSAGKFLLAVHATGEMIAWSFLITLGADDYIELVWQAADTDISLEPEVASGNIPAIPSAVMCISYVSNDKVSS